MINLKSSPFIVIMLLNERSTQVHLQKDPRLHFGESFTLNLKKIGLLCAMGMCTPGWIDSVVDPEVMTSYQHPLVTRK